MKLLDQLVALLFRRAAVRREAREAAYLSDAADLNELALRVQELERHAGRVRRPRKGDAAPA
ncbi:hypothetical protein WM40_17065 [Robbsia andropogonis]|uniref:DUF3563 domain-containing protein n=1 Tax=Robbsia andropogonis TaxID=28092 RepID=A0A0F5JXS5_9BURK|nr:hypothetical protein [Robbsia andropogonis]KKB62510.1 hypothetical protein WM40_17065 [Robbsia andropogonis]MCP1116986.1 hypothetical protein [Robbsia andropogonis]MCP1126335.1 hypothetical protein [Robbsia andropogonis]